MTVVEERPAQHVVSMRRAQEMQRRRGAQRSMLAQLHPEVARARAAALVLDPPEELHTLRVDSFLRWLPLIGPAKITRLLAEQEISSLRTLGRGRQRDGRVGITDRQARAIAKWLTRSST